MEPFSLIVAAILMFAAFFAGIALANWYNDKAQAALKEAIERQYLRLRAGADADDPCKPYMFSQPPSVNPVDPIPGYGPISPEFMDELRATGKARTQFNKSEVS